MANELQEFLKLLGRIIAWIFLWTLNLICFCLFLISCIALWRTYWIISDVLSSSNMSKFREHATVQFFIVIGDILVLPFGIIGLLIPTRTYHVIKDVITEFNKTYTQTYYSGDTYQYAQVVRWVLFSNFWLGMI